MCSEDTQDNGADSVLPHDGDFQHRGYDIQCQDGDGDDHEEHQKGGEHLGEHTLEDLNHNLSSKVQQEYGNSQEGAEVDQNSDDGSSI